MKPINTSTFDFPTLIQKGFVYVDKTAQIYELARQDTDGIYFFPRPRRFGESAAAALKQCRERNYAAAFADDPRPVSYIGVNYNPADSVRTTDDVACERVP